MKPTNLFNYCKTTLRHNATWSECRFLRALMVALLLCSMNSHLIAVSVSPGVNTDSSSAPSESGDRFNADSFLGASNPDNDQHWTLAEDVGFFVLAIAGITAITKGCQHYYDSRNSRNQAGTQSHLRDSTALNDKTGELENSVSRVTSPVTVANNVDNSDERLGSLNSEGKDDRDAIQVSQGPSNVTLDDIKNKLLELFLDQIKQQADDFWKKKEQAPLVASAVNYPVTVEKESSTYSATAGEYKDDYGTQKAMAVDESESNNEYSKIPIEQYAMVNEGSLRVTSPVTVANNVDNSDERLGSLNSEGKDDRDAIQVSQGPSNVTLDDIKNKLLEFDKLSKKREEKDNAMDTKSKAPITRSLEFNISLFRLTLSPASSLEYMEAAFVGLEKERLEKILKGISDEKSESNDDIEKRKIAFFIAKNKFSEAHLNGFLEALEKKAENQAFLNQIKQKADDHWKEREKAALVASTVNYPVAAEEYKDDHRTQKAMPFFIYESGSDNESDFNNEEGYLKIK